MIYIGFVLRNPFIQLHSLVREWIHPVTKNTTAEIGLYRTNGIVGFGFSITGFQQDHRGVGFDLDLLGWNLDFTWYDNRHSGDYDK